MSKRNGSIIWTTINSPRLLYKCPLWRTDNGRWSGSNDSGLSLFGSGCWHRTRLVIIHLRGGDGLFLRRDCISEERVCVCGFWGDCLSHLISLKEVGDLEIAGRRVDTQSNLVGVAALWAKSGAISLLNRSGYAWVVIFPEFSQRESSLSGLALFSGTFLIFFPRILNQRIIGRNDIIILIVTVGQVSIHVISSTLSHTEVIDVPSWYLEQLLWIVPLK